MPLEYALKTGVRYEKLLEINDITDKPLAEDMYLYLERKHKKGVRPVHIVKDGETIAQVSRFEGMNAKNIRSLNHLGANEEPVAGTVLQLQGDAPVKPQIVGNATPAMPEVALSDVPPPSAEPAVAVAEPPVPPVAEATTDNTVATTAAPETPMPATEENTPAATIPTEPAAAVAPEPVAEVAPVPAVEEQPAVVQVTEKTDVAPAEVPATPPAAETANALPNPPATINIANEKPVEEVIAEEKKAMAALSQPEVQKPEEPKDELDALKARFDKVVYAKKNAAA